MQMEDRKKLLRENGKKQAERIKKALKEWKENNKELAHKIYKKNGEKNKERIIKALKRWREENPELAKKISIKAGKSQTEKIKRTLSEWRKKHPEWREEAKKNIKYLFFEKPQTTVCLQCGKTFTYIRKQGAKFCSESCRVRYKRQKGK
jgi:gas vesicle protein